MAEVSSSWVLMNMCCTRTHVLFNRAARTAAADVPRRRDEDGKVDGLACLKVEETAAVLAPPLPPTPPRTDTECTDDVNQLAMTTSTLDFKCYYCVATFGQRHQLLGHIVGHYCDDSFTPANVLPDVIGSGEDKTNYQCLFCDKKALAHCTWLTKHIYARHLQEMRFHCKLCELPCDYLGSHDCLAAGQTPKWTHRCVRCRYRFTSAQDSVRHYKDNGKVHAIQCLKCDTVNSSAEKILQHELAESSSPQAVLNRLRVQLPTCRVVATMTTTRNALV